MRKLLLRELEGKQGVCSTGRFQLSKEVLGEQVEHVGKFANLEMIVPESTVEKFGRMIEGRKYRAVLAVRGDWD